ncbi:hypothetical protein K492DRAFT_189837 [Lichtheimia hyalospora FSU 10163]|nr:hypothetical protein K492DRAFT_189837 [Lichtheimia hyalospora FSU 10163]
MDSIYLPHNHLLPSSLVNTGGIPTDINIADPTLLCLPQDHPSVTFHSDISHITQLSTISAQTSSALEDCSVASYIAHVVCECCKYQGGLSNTELVSEMVSWAVTFVASNHSSCEYYFWLTIHQLYKHPVQWNDLAYIPLTAAAQTTPSTPSSPEAQEAACSPLTSSDVSSNGSVSRTMCDYCQRTFARKDALQRHLRLTCTYNKGYTSQHVFAAIE